MHRSGDGEAPEDFFRRQILSGLASLGQETASELRWWLAAESLESAQKPPVPVVEQVVCALNAAWEKGPEGVRFPGGAAHWQSHTTTLLRKPPASGLRILVAAWLREKAPGTLPEDKPTLEVLGFGTRLFGFKDLRKDGSYLATRFVVALRIPIVPLETIRLVEGPRTQEMGIGPIQRSYEVLERFPVDRSQAIRCYAHALLCIALFVAATYVLETDHKDVGAVLLVLAFVFPWASLKAHKSYTRWVSRRSHGRQPARAN